MPCRSPQSGSSRRLAVGIAEFAPAFVAVHDFAADEPGKAEQFGGLHHAVRWRAPRGSAPERTGRPSSSNTRHDVDREAVPCALGGEEIRRAAAGCCRNGNRSPMTRRATARRSRRMSRDEFLGRQARPARRRSAARWRRRGRSSRTGGAWRARRSAGTAADRDGRSRADGARTSAPPPAGRARGRAPSAVAITARWPRCTPSKLPIATTAPARAPGGPSRTTANGLSRCRSWSRDCDTVGGSVRRRGSRIVDPPIKGCDIFKYPFCGLAGPLAIHRQLTGYSTACRGYGGPPQRKAPWHAGV